MFIPSLSEDVIDDLRSGKEIKIARVKSQVYDLIIVTQSCDLKYRKAKFILLCPIFPLKYAEQKKEELRSSKEKERIRRGYRPNLFMLNKCLLEDYTDNPQVDYWIVNFQQVHSLPIELVKAVLPEKRLRLLPPYRESLAQAFARFFMRVALPEDIQKFSSSV